MGPGHRKNRDQGFALKLARRVGAARPEARRQILLRGSRICNGPCSSRCITPFEHRLESVGLPLECGFDCGELCLPIREKVPFDARGSQPFHVVRTERDQARRRAGIRRSTATILAVEVDAIGAAQDCSGMVPHRFEPLGLSAGVQLTSDERRRGLPASANSHCAHHIPVRTAAPAIARSFPWLA